MLLPRLHPGRGQNGQNGPICPDSTPSPFEEPNGSGDLGARLPPLAGGSISNLAPTEKLILDFGRVFTNATQQRFEHRTLLGLVIKATRPEYGVVASSTSTSPGASAAPSAGCEAPPVSPNVSPPPSSKA